ncbi:hypothetical protein NQ317_007740 [Molorchus minor]|uniref:AAA+ ATPase domain-containing protein n=1 Tax=Molorchus minor TaxID=1323400 RepID=A0ABQ9JUL3_9CUCU|nr:hypothetical protein NQ317_007740 [Molorchus minor]
MNDDKSTSCPVCNKVYPLSEIQEHANRCIFLNCPDSQRKKRAHSPVLLGSQNPSRLKLEIKQNSPDNQNAVKRRQMVENVVPVFQNTPGPSTGIGNKKVNEMNGGCYSFIVPLATQVQPKTLDDFFGQSQVLGKNTVLRSLLEKGEVPNMILWGPPGCGKTSLSAIIHEMCKRNPQKYKFVALCAASTGVKEVQNIIEIAKNDMKLFSRRTVMFMDEIHRFNKRQQDTFLLSGLPRKILLFIINSALLSRCRVIVLEKLDCHDLHCILEKAAVTVNVDVVDAENPCGVIHSDQGVAIESTALQWLADISDGDARIALTNLQLVLQNSNNNGKIITVEDIKDGIKKSHLLYDRAGEEHYNIISAMHKSIRGSDANAALYWTTRMIVSGEDPRYIARRLVRAASEDIGNADPNALQLAVTTMQGCQLLGMPEADVLLSQCAIYLARAPKSREADSALAKAKVVIEKQRGSQPSVPMHIRNAPTRLMKELGYGRLKDGEDYGYMPPELKDVDFFN